jgi:hypothetical protein
MVDLAGSEQNSSLKWSDDDTDNQNLKTPMNKTNHSNNKMILNQTNEKSEQEKKELKYIRRSLNTLGTIIRSLSQGESIMSLPYRDSMLTLLLKDALSGHGYTAMIATLSPSHACYEESMETLKYVERLRFVPDQGVDGLDSTRRSVSRGAASLRSSIDEIRDGLSATKPGTQTHRQLLQHTVSDPQQRLAKLGLFGSNENGTHKNDANILPAEARDDVEKSLRDACRALQAQVVELQIELQTARTDRDSASVELKSIQDAYSASKANFDAMENELKSLRKGLERSEKELNEVRGVLTRKEDTIDRLLADFHAEKKSKEAVEKGAQTQNNEFFNRLERLQR